MPSWKSIVTRVGDVLDKLTGGIVGDGIDAVGTGLNTLRGIVTTIIDTGANVLSGALQVGASVVSSIADTGANLIAGALQIGASVVQSAIDVGGNVLGGLLEIAGSIVSGVTDIGGNIISGILQVAGALGSAIADAVGSALTGALEVTGALGQFIADVIGNLLSGMLQVAASLGGFISDGAFGIVHAVTDLAGSIVNGAERVGSAVEGVGETAVKGALSHKEEILAALLGGPFGLILEELFREHPDLRDKLLSLIEESAGTLDHAASSAAEAVFDHLVGGGHVEPEQAPGLAAALFAVQAGAGAALHAVALTKDAVPFFPNEALTYMMAFLGKFTGWEHGVSAIFEPTIKGAIGRPFEQLINKGTTTQLPRESELGELFARRHTESFDYSEGLSRHGLFDTWRVVLQESAYRPARIFELARIMQFADIDEAALTHMLNDAAYRPEVVPELQKALRAVGLSRANGKLMTEATEARQKGFIDEGQYGAVMEIAGIKPTEQALWQLAATAAYNNEVKSELVSVWRSAAARDALSDDELRAALSVIGVTGGKQDVEVLRAQAARLRKAVDDVAAEEKKAVNQARATFATAYRTQFKKGLIDAGALASALSAIGYADIQVQAFVELALAEVAPAAAVVGVDTPEAVSRRVRADLQQAYVLQFQHDLIDAATLRGSLVAIGVNDLEAASIVAREQARKTPSPVVFAKATADRVAAEVQATLQAAYIQQFRGGLISADELEANLLQIGVDPTAANARRRLEETKAFLLPAAGALTEEEHHARELQAAQKAAAVEEFRKGIITADELDAALVDAGIAADVAAAIVETELARAFKPAP